MFKYCVGQCDPYQVFKKWEMWGAENDLHEEVLLSSFYLLGIYFKMCEVSVGRGVEGTWRRGEVGDQWD